MSVIIVGTAFLYGDPWDKPALPVGWNYIAKKGEWLLAESPEGKRYFVSAATSEKPATLTRCKTANLWDVIRTLPNYLHGRRPFRIGSIFVNANETILI